MYTYSNKYGFHFRDNNITSVIDTSFSVEHDSFGQIQVHELKPNGKEIPVTDENKREYVR